LALGIPLALWGGRGEVFREKRGKMGKKIPKLNKKCVAKPLGFPVTLSSSKNQLSGQRLTLITVTSQANRLTKQKKIHNKENCTID
jgi:hypothetical protein